MKKLSIGVILCLIHPLLFSQAEMATSQDPAAEPILDHIATILSANLPQQIEFRYEVESRAENYKVEDYGSVIIKGQKYKLKTDEGDVYYNGSKMWTYNPVNQEVYVSTPDPEILDQMLTAPFILMNDYKKYFKYKLKDEVSDGNKVFHEIDLYPVSLESSYSILRIQVEKKTNRLHTFTLHQKNGVIFRIFITEIITKLNVNDDIFTWNKEQNPEVMVIEL